MPPQISRGGKKPFSEHVDYKYRIRISGRILVQSMDHATFLFMGVLAAELGVGFNSKYNYIIPHSALHGK